MVGRILLLDVVLVAQLDLEIPVIASLHDPAVRVRILERLGRGQLDFIPRVLLVVAVDDHVARVLRCDGDELAAELRKGWEIHDLVRRILADGEADHARADVVLREDILLLARLGDPDALRADRVLARLDANEEIIVRGRHKFEFVLRQLLRYLLHHGDLEAVRFALLVHIVIGHIVVRMCDRDRLLAVCGLCAVRAVLAAARESCGECRCEESRECRLADFLEVHWSSLLYRAPAAARTHAKRFQSMSRGTVQSAPRMTPVRPAAARMRCVSASTSARVPL